MRWAPWKNIPLRCGWSVQPAFLATFAGVVKDAWRNHRVVGKDGKGNLLKG